MLPALAICLFSLAILERDGFAALVGALVAAVSIVVAWGVLYALVKGMIFIIRNALALVVATCRRQRPHPELYPFGLSALGRCCRKMFFEGQVSNIDSR